MTLYPARFYDENNELRLGGTLDADIGGSLPLGWQSFTGVTDVLPGTGNGQFDFTTFAGITPHIDPDGALLDLSDPVHPTFIAAGVYAVSFTATTDDGAHEGKYLVTEVGFSTTTPIDASTPRSYQSAELKGPGGGFCWAGITFKVNAGDPMFCSILHDIGVDTAFDVNVYIQQVG